MFIKKGENKGHQVGTRESGKRGQMKMSFGMIFSLILIIVFLAFAFYIIAQFLDMQRCAQSGKFIDELQKDVNNIWKSPEANVNPDKPQYHLPDKVEEICFIDYSKDSSGRGPDREKYAEMQISRVTEKNLFFYPIDSGECFDAVEIKHINISKITEQKNPYCIKNREGIKIPMKKNFEDNLVCLGDNC